MCAGKYGEGKRQKKNDERPPDTIKEILKAAPKERVKKALPSKPTKPSLPSKKSQPSKSTSSITNISGFTS
jgi:predicted flap endonuclease-1-like 5' DNA nuclease